MDSGNSGSSSGDDDHDSQSSRHQSFAAAGFGHISTTPNLFVTTNTNTGLFDPFLQPQQQPMSLGGQYQSGHLSPGPALTRPVNGMGVIRSSKKRSRASKRAPTTVLTTDTSNFRAMVQEFTGIPAPPFSATPYSRLSALRSGHVHPLRPFATNAAPIFNPPGSGLNIHNPILSFQSLLQQPQHHHQMISSLEDQIQAGQTTHHQVNAAPTQHQLFTDNNNSNSSSGAKFDYVPARCDGTVDSWICPPG